MWRFLLNAWHEIFGDIISISNDRKNVDNVSAIQSKGSVIINQIMTIIWKTLFWSGSHMEKLVYLISSLLTSAEAWFNLSKGDIDTL